MSSRRYTLKDRLERSITHVDKALAFLWEINQLFNQYGDYYKEYIDFIEANAELLYLVAQNLEKFGVSPLVIRMHMKKVENIVRKCLEVEKDAKGVGCKEVREDN